MVIDAKLPPDESAPLSVPPPAYAPSSEDSSDPSSNAPQQSQQYPPSSSQTYPTSHLPQWQTPGTGSQSMPPDEWVGQQYRNQRKHFLGRSVFLNLVLFLVLAQCARGNHDQTTSFGLCGIICAILLFPIGLIFLWYVITRLFYDLRKRLVSLASTQKRSVHDVECD